MGNLKSFSLLTVFSICFLVGSGCGDDNDDSDKDAGTMDGSVSEDGRSFFCHYNSPFVYRDDEKVQPECKAYVGTEWTEETAADDCRLPFGPTFAEIETDLSETPCSDGTVAYCTMNSENDRISITSYYQLDPPPAQGEEGVNLSAIKSGCEGFAKGIYEGEIEVATTSSPLLPEALEACKSTATVQVTPDNVSDEKLADMRENGGYLYFEPLASPPEAGVIFYPGGRVDSRAFAPAAQILANAGIAVALLPVPDYMAISKGAETRPDPVISDHGEIEHWFMAGHSVGGVGAAIYAHANEHPVSGIIVLGVYISADHDMSDRDDLAGLVMISSEEELGTEGMVEYDNFIQGQAYAPPGSTFITIEGGNHFGFCYQENPRGNEVATITVEEQHIIYTNAIIELVEEVVSGK
jgi:hypothetical protein